MSSNLITPDDEENYGHDLIDLAKRAARDTMDPELNALLHEILSQLAAMQMMNTGSFSAALVTRLLIGGGPPAKLITPEDEEVYGTELIDLAKRAARDAMHPELNTLRQELLSQIAAMQKMNTGTMSDALAAHLLMGGGTPTKLITAKDAEDYGNELIDLAKRATKEAMAPELNALREGLLSQFAAVGANSARDAPFPQPPLKRITPKENENQATELIGLAKRAATETTARYKIAKRATVAIALVPLIVIGFIGGGVGQIGAVIIMVLQALSIWAIWQWYEKEKEKDHGGA